MMNNAEDFGITENEMAELRSVCLKEGKTVLEKVREVVRSFLAKGDNHHKHQLATA